MTDIFEKYAIPSDIRASVEPKIKRFRRCTAENILSNPISNLTFLRCNTKLIAKLIIVLTEAPIIEYLGIRTRFKRIFTTMAIAEIFN